MVKTIKSVKQPNQEYGNLIGEHELESLGIVDFEEFQEVLHLDIMKMVSYPEEPLDLNGTYLTDTFEVLHTIVGDIEGEEPFGFGRSTYNIVDIGIPDKKMIIILVLEVSDADEDGINEYDLVEHAYFLMEDGDYINYLMKVENERDII